MFTVVKMPLKAANYVRLFGGVSKEHIPSCSFALKTDLSNSVNWNWNENYSVNCNPTNINLRYFSSQVKLSHNKATAHSVEFSPNLPDSNGRIKLLVADLMKFVEKVVHMDEMIEAQAKVMQIKDALIADRSRKTDIIFELNRIREDLKRCHENICNATRGSERHLALIREEGQLLDKEQEKQLEFAKADELERENFTKLTVAINNSFQKEQIYTHTLKNIGIICTLIGSLVSFVGASIGFYLHNKKSGSLVQNLKETVNDIVVREVGLVKEQLRDSVRELAAELRRSQQSSSEGWGEYLKRHTVRAYRWVWPAKTK